MIRLNCNGQMIADSGNMFHLGNKAGHLPPPEALNKLA